MAGRLSIEEGDIYGLLELCAANLSTIEEHWLHRWREALELLARRLGHFNPRGRSRRNVAHHYDLSGRLYELFLDADKQYSCAYFARPDDSLEQAQEAKKHRLAAKLLLQPGHRVLDIGSGWGGLGLHLARESEAQVVGVTLSEEQHRVSRQRAQAADLDDRVDFLLQDYRALEGSFDRIVSVGMFEHVGTRHYPEFFAKCRDLLTDDGIAVLHTIGRAGGPSSTSAWTRKYIFPGGYSPALSEVVPAIEQAGMVITDVEVLRLHYAETLRAWRQRLEKNRDEVIELYDERFLRMWEFYLSASEAMFRYGGHVVFQIQLAKCQEAVPITRAYLDRDYRQAPQTPIRRSAAA
jgi:cyclopropane-fatty-acyl-phospholipid synthase